MGMPRESSLLHRLTSNPRVYDVIQFLTGGPLAARAMRRWLAAERGLVIDVGGGTGRLKPLLPAGTNHVCVDLDPLKLSAYAMKFADARPVYGDALHLPLRSGVAPLVALIAVSHHLTDAQLETALREAARVQAPGGQLFFLDALLIPERWASRVLWRHDQGSHPRNASGLVAALQKHFRIVERFEYTLLHRYLVCRCTAL